MSSWPLCLWAGPCASYPRRPCLDPAMKEDGPEGATEAPPERSWLSHAKHAHRSQDGHSYDTVISLWVSLRGAGLRLGVTSQAKLLRPLQVPSVLNMSTVTDGLIWPSAHTQIPFHRTPTPGGCHSEGQTVGWTGGTEPSLAWLHLQTRGHILPASP